MRIGDLAWWLLVVKFATPLVVAHALGRTAFVHVAAVVAWMLAASIASELVIATFRRRMHARWEAERLRAADDSERLAAGAAYLDHALATASKVKLRAWADAGVTYLDHAEAEVFAALDAGRLDDARALLREFFEEEREQLYDAAAVRGMTTEEREASELTAEERELCVVVDEHDFAMVLEMVEAPPEPTPQLVELLKRTDDPGAP